eukprot:3046732-Amphidinium_carterae.1
MQDTLKSEQSNDNIHMQQLCESIDSLSRDDLTEATSPKQAYISSTLCYIGRTNRAETRTKN